MRRTFLWVVILMGAFLDGAFAQETGEMVHFDHRVKIRMEITETLLLKQVGAVIGRTSVSEVSRQPFNRILLNGMVPDPSLILQVRTESAEGGWSDWTEMRLRIFENGRFWGRLDLGERPASRMQLRFVNGGITTPGIFEIYAVEVDDGGREYAEEEGAGDRPGPPMTKTEGTIEMPQIISRQEWGAQPPIGTYVPHDPYRLTQHHTAGRRIQTLEDGLAEMRFIQDFHQNGRGWQDIGYHFCVDDAGRIYEGVPPDFRGTHTGGHNTGNVGISLFGNFDVAGEIPSPASLDGLVMMWSWLAFHYEVNPDMLLGHRDYTSTSCPGDNLYSELGEMRNGIRKALEFGGPYVANPEPQPFSLEVSPDSFIAFLLRDDEEGVDVNSITVRVNGDWVTPNITGSQEELSVSYQPVVPFPSSRTVIVEIEAADLAGFPNWMDYSYSFTIEVEALYLEVETEGSMRNAELELNGDWSSDGDDVDLEDLVDGRRLFTVDDDCSHSARLFPAVEAEGDYRVLMAVNGQFLGESAHFRFVNATGLEHPHLAEYNGVFDGRWGLLSPTPVHFDSGAQTEAFVEVSGLPDLETRLVLDAFRLERVDPLDPPMAPTLKWARGTDFLPREVEVCWYPSLEGDILGYRLFVSSDGRTWNDPLVDETTLGPASSSHTISVEGSASTLFVRLVAVDINGIESVEGDFENFLSPPTDTYGAGYGSGPKILIVDNFDRQASWSDLSHAFVRSHGEAIAAHRFSFDSCTETAVQTGEITLGDYDAVFYFCGDDSRSDESLAAADQLRLLEYLRQGGKLFVSGSEIGYDFNATTSTELERVQHLLKATYVGDHSGSNRVLGADQTPFEGLDFIYGTLDSEDTYVEDYPDYVLPAGGGQVALWYDNLRVAAVSFAGTYGSGDPEAQLVYMAFPFETINQPEDRAALIKRTFNFFGFPIQVANRPPLEVD